MLGDTTTIRLKKSKVLSCNKFLQVLEILDAAKVIKLDLESDHYLLTFESFGGTNVEEMCKGFGIKIL